MRFLNNQYGRFYQSEEGGDGGDGASGGGGAGGDGGDGGGGGSDNPMDAFFGSVSDEGLRTEAASMFTEKTPDDFIKTAINAQKMMGNSFRIPDEDAGDEAWDKFYGKMSDVKGLVVNKDGESLNRSLGVPETPDGYEVDLSGLPDDISIDQGELDARRAYWHKLGMTPRQVDLATKDWVEQEVSEDAEWKEMNTKAEKALKAEFGAAYDDKMELVRFVAKNVMEQEDVEYLKASGALMRPGVVKAFAKLGESLKEDGTIESARKSQGNYAPAEAKAKIEELRQNPAYWDDTQPEHKSLVAKVAKLYEQANAG